MSYDVKYIGMDVHKEAIVIAVLNEDGKLVMESVIETKASSILQFLHGLRGELHVTWEEGTWAAWLYDRMSRKRLMYSVGTDPPEEKSDLCSLDRIHGGNEANEVDQQSHPWDGERVIGLRHRNSPSDFVRSCCTR